MTMVEARNQDCILYTGTFEEHNFQYYTIEINLTAITITVDYLIIKYY